MLADNEVGLAICCLDDFHVDCAEAVPGRAAVRAVVDRFARAGKLNTSDRLLLPRFSTSRCCHDSSVKATGHSHVEKVKDNAVIEPNGSLVRVIDAHARGAGER